jgi:hypothetical protein
LVTFYARTFILTIFNHFCSSDSIDNMGLDEILAMPWLGQDADTTPRMGGFGGLFGEGARVEGGLSWSGAGLVEGLSDAEAVSKWAGNGGWE